MDETTNEVIDEVDTLIRQARKTLESAPKSEEIRTTLLSMIEPVLYNVPVQSFIGSLVEENFDEFNIPGTAVETLKQKYGDWFASESNKITAEEYSKFREDVKAINQNIFNLLEYVEGYMQFGTAEKMFNNFKEESQDLGNEIQVEYNDGSEGDFGITIGLKNDIALDDDDNYLDEINNFENFDMDLSDGWATLEDGAGHFFGQYRTSKNGSFIMVFSEGIANVDDEGKTHHSGQVYLIDNSRNKILWKKRLERPNEGFVTNDGDVIIIDWGPYDRQFFGILYIFDMGGNEVLKESYENGNITVNLMSDDDSQIIIMTPVKRDRYIYLYDIKKRKTPTSIFLIYLKMDWILKASNH